jgi:hypothetical protein
MGVKTSGDSDILIVFGAAAIVSLVGILATIMFVD